jgi:hypothetical protein
LANLDKNNYQYYTMPFYWWLILMKITTRRNLILVANLDLAPVLKERLVGRIVHQRVEEGVL